MSNKIMITTDSTADLGHLFKELNIPNLPLAVNLGDDSFLDGENIFPEDIYKFVAEKKVLPKTAARSIEDFKAFFESFTSLGYEVIHFNISSYMSASNANAIKAAAELDEVFVVDSLSLSTGTGLLALYAYDLAKSGKYGGKEIAEMTRKRTGAVQASFVVDTLSYLYKGGRCSGIASFAATVLKIKPTILVSKGEMIVGKKYMGGIDKSIIKYVESTIETFNTPDLKRVFITHTNANESTINLVKEKLKKMANFEEIIVTSAGATITSHCGKGTLGILYLNDGNIK